MLAGWITDGCAHGTVRINFNPSFSPTSPRPASGGCQICINCHTFQRLFTPALPVFTDFGRPRSGKGKRTREYGPPNRGLIYATSGCSPRSRHQTAISGDPGSSLNRGQSQTDPFRPKMVHFPAGSRRSGHFPDQAPGADGDDGGMVRPHGDPCHGTAATAGEARE